MEDTITFDENISDSNRKEQVNNQLFLQSIVDSPKDTIILCLDSSYRYLLFNKAHENDMMQAYGRLPELGHCIFDYMTDEEDIQKIKKQYDQALQGNHMLTTEIYGDKTKKYYEIHVNPVYNHDKEIIGITSVAQDITEKKKAEDLLKETLDATTDGIWTWNFKTDTMFFSDRYYKMLGYEPQEFNSTFENWMNLIHPEDKKRALALAEEYLKHKPDIYENSFRLKTKTGDYRWLKSKARVVERDANGEAIRLIGNHEDITEKKQKEEQLKLERKRFHDLLETFPAFVYLQSSDYSIKYANGFFKDVFGDPGDKPCYELLHNRSEPCEVCPTFKLFQSPDPQIWEWNNAPNGKKYLIYDYPFRDNDGSKLVLEIGVDITNKKKVEEELIEKERLLREAQQIAKIGSWSYDVKNMDLWWSDELYHLYGLNPKNTKVGLEHGIGMIHPDDKHFAEKTFQKAIETGEPYEMVYRINKSDGEERYIRAIGRVEKDGQGNIIRVHGTGQDVTEKKKSEQKEKFLGDIVRTTSVAIAVGYPDGRIGFYNDAFLKLIGYTEEEIKDIGWSKITPKRWEIAETKKLQELLDTKEPVVYEKEYIKKDGSTVPIELVVHGSFDEQGTIQYYKAFITDITDRKKSERELREREQKYRRYIENAPHGVFICDEHGKYLEVNDEAVKTTGYSEDELLNMSIADILPNEGKEQGLQHFQTLLKEGKSFCEAPFIHKDGSVRWWQVNAVRLSEDRFLAFTLDITEKMEMEQKLQRVFSMSSELICEADINTATFTKINPTFTEVLGYSEKELLNHSFMEFIHPDDKEPTQKVIDEQLKRGKKVLTFINRYRCKDGSYVWLDWNSHPVPEKGFTYAIARDITEKKKADEQIINEKKTAERYLHLAGSMILSLDTNGRITLLNKKGYEILGYEEGELSGKNWFDTCLPDYKVNEVKGVFEKKMNGEIASFEQYDAKIKRKNGEERYITWNNTVLTNEDGIITGTLSSGSDITEKKKIEESLKRSEEKYRNIVELAPDGIIIMNLKGYITSVNPAFLSLSGFSREEIEGKHFSKLPTIFESDIKTYATIIKTLLLGGESKTINFKWKKKNGEPRLGQAKIKVMKVEGKGRTVQAIVRDVTEQEQAHQQLVQSKKETEMILNTAGDGIRIVTKDLKIKTVNDTFAEMVGLSKDEIIGRNCSDVFKSDVCGTDNCPLRKVLQTGEGFEEETSRKTLDDREIKCILKVTPYRDEHNEIIGIIEDFRDITNLKQSQQRFQSIFENKGTATGIFGDDSVIAQCNSKFVEQSGYSRDEIIGRMHWYDFVHKDDIEEMMRFHKQRSAGGKPPGLYECRMVTKNGEIRTMIVNIGIIPDSKERVVSLVDITKQKNAEHKLENLNRNLGKEVEDRTQQIQRLLVQKDEFINQLGHDIKNPLGPLVNLLPLLEKNENDPKKKDMIQVMNRNVRYIKNLVSKTIQLAQLKSPSTGLHFEQLNLSDEINDVIDTNRLLFEENHITVQNNISNELMVDADKLKLHEVFNNLLNNAVKYNKEDGGDIIISQTFNDDDMLTISVKDTGVGMTGEQLEKVFNEFYKADSSRHDFDSSGLGMSITKRIVELHGGKIWAESQGPGKGSTFYFNLPRNIEKTLEKEEIES